MWDPIGVNDKPEASTEYVGRTTPCFAVVPLPW
jgi:hypothetical protein